LGFSRFLSQTQECENDGFLTLPIDLSRLLLSERGSKRDESGKGLIRHGFGPKVQSQDQYGTVVSKARGLSPAGG
jgi:hypothetical protein